MRSLMRFHITEHDRLVAESGSPLHQRSRQQAGCQHTQIRLDLSQELNEALLVHTVCCVRFWPKLYSITVVQLGLLLLWGLEHADGCDCSAGFLLGHCCTFFSLARCRRNPLEFELHLMQLVCLPREVSGHSHEVLFHAVYLERGMSSRLRYHEKMVS